MSGAEGAVRRAVDGRSVEPRIARGFRTACSIIALYVVAVGAFVLLSWTLALPIPKDIIPGPAIPPAAGAGFVALGAALWLVRDPASSRGNRAVSRTLGAAILALGLGTILIFVASRATTLGPASASLAVLPYPIAAGAFAFLGARLLLIDASDPRLRTFGLALAIGDVAIGLFGLLSYVYGLAVPAQLAAGNTPFPMPIAAALNFILLSFATIAVRAEHNFMQVFLAMGAPGRAARRLTLSLLTVPILLGGIVSLCVRTGIFDVNAGFALFAVASAGTLSVIGWRTSVALQSQEKTESHVRELFERTVMAAPDAILVVDSSGRITLVNDTVKEVFGHEPADLVGKPVEVLIPERLRSVHLEARRAFAGDPHRRPMGIGLDLVGRRADGSEVPVEVSLSPVKMIDGEYVVVALRDISVRMDAQEAIRRLNVSRPLVRKILRELVGRASIDGRALEGTGRALASTVDATSIPGYVDAYMGLGLGELSYAGPVDGKHAFHGRDLVEFEGGARLPTCFLALGYLTGAVARADGATTALGTELRCQSRGDAKCEFVIMARPKGADHTRGAPAGSANPIM